MKKKSINKLKKLSIISVVLLSISSIILYLYKIYQNIEISKENYRVERVYSTTEAQTVENIEKNSIKIADVIENVTRKVVGISKLKNTGSSIFSRSTESELGLGTGFIVSEDGYIVSNEHVTGSKYSQCYVTLENGNNYQANVIWSDSDLDLSIIKINAKNLEYIKLGDSNKIRVGEAVYAIGNPIGHEFQRTVTKGIVSGINRTIKIVENEKEMYMEDLIQTDATINEGNSGGALINEVGELLGINTIKITDAEGIGFAIPINVIKPVLEKLIKFKEIQEVSLGIHAFDKEVIPYLNSGLKFESGIYVVSIDDNSVLKDKLIVGDIIESIDTKNINKMNELRNILWSKNPGDKVVLKVKRNSEIFDIEVELKSKTY